MKYKLYKQSIKGKPFVTNGLPFFFYNDNIYIICIIQVEKPIFVVRNAFKPIYTSNAIKLSILCVMPLGMVYR